MIRPYLITTNDRINKSPLPPRAAIREEVARQYWDKAGGSHLLLPRAIVLGSCLGRRYGSSLYLNILNEESF
ncbi:unnamed protein product [Nezara viridula]|uniref:Uncharacterized protein n=1 Tax=Nezara viridula TaxID=85310 RepID=A0A9P0HRJ1_NEZVI|nr:unnamed protein product [Nezara viridula]